MKKLDPKIIKHAKAKMLTKKIKEDPNDPRYLPPLTWKDYLATANGEIPDILSNNIKRGK